METKLKVKSLDSPLPLDHFQKIPRHPVFTVLDNLRSAFNVGSIIRTADCALLEKIYFCGYTAHPPHKKLDKTSLGAMPYVPWEYNDSIVDTVQALRKKGISIISLETTNRSKLIWEYRFPVPVALILGNEALGVSKEVLELSDDIVEIPMLGYKNSINVAVAFGIAVYEIQRQHWNHFSNESLVTAV